MDGQMDDMEAHTPLSEEQLQRLAVYFSAYGEMTQETWAELAGGACVYTSHSTPTT